MMLITMSNYIHNLKEYILCCVVWHWAFAPLFCIFFSHFPNFPLFQGPSINYMIKTPHILNDNVLSYSLLPL